MDATTQPYEPVRENEDAFDRELKLPSNPSSWLGWGYVVMCVSFAIVQGAASATIALGVAYAGNLGSASAGLTFACHTLSALLLSGGVSKRVGAKASLCLGSCLMTLYVMSYITLHVGPTGTDRIFILCGSILGGTGTGLIWTAQGVYMTRLVREHAHRTGLRTKKVSGWAAGLFAAIALGGEVTIKALCTPIDMGTPRYLFVILAALAGVATIMLAFIRREPVLQRTASSLVGNTSTAAATGCGAIGPAMTLLRKDKRILSLLPFNICFGLSLAFLNYYVIGQLGKKAFGMSSVGVIAALKPAGASFLALPYSFVTQRVGKRAMIFFAAINYLTVASICLVLTEEQLIHYRGLIVMLCVLAGSGRAVFEGANKGLLTDIFRDNVEGAFANVIFQSGGGATIGFFLYPHLERISMASLLVGVATAGALGILTAPSSGALPPQRRFSRPSSLRTPIQAHTNDNFVWVNHLDEDSEEEESLPRLRATSIGVFQ